MRLTKLELEAIIDTAENMRDDLESYYSFIPEKDRKKFIKAYETGLDKMKQRLSQLK